MSWKVKSSRYVIDRPWIKLREDHVVLPSGVEMEEFHVVEYPNWAATVCIDQDDNLVLVEQYRHGIHRSSLELPAGVIEPDEDPLEAAKRELIEETGYIAPNWNSSRSIFNGSEQSFELCVFFYSTKCIVFEGSVV